MLARLTGKAGGVDDLSVAEYPGPLGIHDAAEIKRNVEAGLVEKIVDALTRFDGSGAATTDAARDPRAIVHSGTAEEVNAFFSSKEWSDGLPIVPPTTESVERPGIPPIAAPMQRSRSSRQRICTRHPLNVAVNAVMAGCRPEHMPLIIAAVEALGDERCSLNNIGSSSGIIPYVLVNGPIVRELGIQSGSQLVSRGPNPAIGRAIGLIVRNIAGFRPGASYMGTFGYPLAFALAEHEDESPWEPFHVEQGFDRNASTDRSASPITGAPRRAHTTRPTRAVRRPLSSCCAKRSPRRRGCSTFRREGPMPRK